MSDTDYIEYLERQFASSSHPDDPPHAFFVVTWSERHPTEEAIDVSRAMPLLHPTSSVGPAFGLTPRDIQKAARKLRDGTPLSYRQQMVKRVLDLLIAVPAFVLVAILTPIIALIIRLDSPGPVFYRQERVGLGGRRFLMWKFRTMRLDASDHLLAVAALADGEGSGGTLFKLRDDPRVTRVGRILRRYSLDELPQFVNVLIGDMSIVGPRPYLPVESHSRRPLTVLPGITGLWAVSGRWNLSWESMVKLDDEYATNWTLRADLDILANTFMVIFRSGQ